MTRPTTTPVHRIRNLRPALEAAGVYKPTRVYHVLWFAATLALYGGSLAVLLGAPSLGVRALAIVGAAIAVMQIGLFAHEVGHGAVTRSPAAREVLGQLTNSFLIGFGFSHWQSTHPVHHNHPNTEGVDPDIESAGYALHENAARRARGLAARLQPATLILGFLLWGFGIRIAAVVHAVRHLDRRTAVDLVLVSAHVAAWIALGLAFGALPAMAINYAAITVLNGIYMGAILVVPHVGTGSRRADEELPFFERQVVHSRNYNASLIGTLLCGGLNLQIEHHLLPGVPCIRLRRARPAILAYCERHGLPYRQMGYWTAWREVLRHGRRMAQIAREHVAGTGERYQQEAA
ncbi:MAG TPA: acyl-CoA desaturase [Kofleriaceae bacterium]|nr:acyl-CoA desaturase [Kofleriaceae bacterium]